MELLEDLEQSDVGITIRQITDGTKKGNNVHLNCTSAQCTLLIQVLALPIGNGYSRIMLDQFQSPAH